MKTEKTIVVPTVGGGENTIRVLITNEHRGLLLGSAICGNDAIFEEITDHIEREDAETMTFDFGTIRKDRILSLEWHNDGFGSLVHAVRFTR